MALSDEQRLTLTAVAAELLEALDAVAQRASGRLAGTVVTDPRQVLAFEANPMAHARQAGVAKDASSAREKLKRKVIERLSLRDQPILDRYQGEVFRLPLDRRLVLLGPPGTGKTTTLIRRLAQNRMPETLTEEELEALSAAGLGEVFLHSHSWAMFSPTETPPHGRKSLPYDLAPPRRRLR